LKLPGNAIGITDLLSYQDCPRRFAFGMRRHDKSPVVHPETGVEYVMGDAPEAESPATAYGSAVHDAIELVDDLLTPEEAVERVFPTYGPWLEPADLDRLIEDLAIYKGRDYTGVRIVAQEDDMRVPLFVHEGETIYFRFKLDKLYQRLDDDASFIHIDYKTSKWAKSQEEVHKDLQMWAYNFGIHEAFPECERLLQTYDQLRFGQVNTRKTEKQRAQMKAWLIAATKAVLADRALLPKFNQWCPWCEIANDCPVIKRLSDYSLSKIAVMAPEEKQGRKKVITLDPQPVRHVRRGATPDQPRAEDAGEGREGHPRHHQGHARGPAQQARLHAERARRRDEVRTGRTPRCLRATWRRVLAHHRPNEVATGVVL
jgi:hypothetical protein